MLRRYSNTAVPTVLSVAVNDSATTLTVPSTSAFPAAPFLLAVERGTSREEVCLCTAKDATTFTVERGYDGTAAQAHDINSLVEHVAAAIDYREGFIARIDTEQRDLLSGNELWEGRVVYNTDKQVIEVRLSGEWARVGLPPGVLVPYAGDTAPPGALMADGSAVSRTTYADLFARIGTTFGSGDGSTTFNLPNMTGRFPLGKAAGGTGSGLGDTGGELNHRHSGPSHSHGNPSTGSAGSHAHSQGNTGAAGSHAHGMGRTGHGGSHDHDESSSNIWGQGGRNFEGGASGHKHDIFSSGNHDHGLPNTSGTGNHAHSTPNTNSNGNHNHSVGSTGSSGGGQTGSANPPFIALNYIIFV